MLAQAHARKATGGPEGDGAGDQGRAVAHAPHIAKIALVRTSMQPMTHGDTYL